MWFTLTQVVGTHNSYHLPPPDAIQGLAWNPIVDTLAAEYAQAAVNTSQYSHLDLYQQLDLGKLHCWKATLFTAEKHYC